MNEEEIKHLVEADTGSVAVHVETLFLLIEAGVLDKDVAIARFEKAIAGMEKVGTSKGRKLALQVVVKSLREGIRPSL